MKVFFNGQLEAYEKDVIRRHEAAQLEKLKELQKHTEHAIKPAFRCGGVQYFEFDDINNLLCGRAFQAMDYYNELGMKATREYLEAHCAAIEDTLNADEIKLTNILQLTMQLRERLEMIFSPDIMYKIASVVYFDDTEKPYSYDDAYGRKKIEHWKAHDIDDFFLLKPIRELIPSLELSKKDLAIFMTTEKKINQEHLNVISTMLSPSHAKKDWFKNLGLQKPRT